MSGKNENAKMIQSIYSLTPMQEGMLYHYMEEEETTDYVIQSIFSLQGNLNEAKLKESLELLFEKYEILRTFFIYEKMDSPKQVVLKSRKPELSKWSLDDLAETEKQRKLDEIKQQDLLRRFDLQKDVLLRVTYIKVGKQEHKIIWSFHHIIMDGWCSSYVFGDFFRYYNMAIDGCSKDEIRKKIVSEKAGVSDYSEYIKWLEHQDHQAAKNYFKRLVTDYEEESGITSCDRPPGYSDKQMERVNIDFEKIEVEQVVQLAQKTAVTLNTVFEAAWGILLQSYNHSSDVIYGKVVSGRSAKIRGIEEMVGLFINTVPVRIKCSPDMTVETLLQNTLKQGIETSSYDYCSLAEIQSQSVNGASFIKTILAFQNVYINEKKLEDAEENFNIDLESMREQTNYNLSLSIFADEHSIRIDLLFNPNEYSRFEIDLLLGRLKKIILAFTNGIDDKVLEIQTLPEKEIEILKQFNDTYLEYDQFQTLTDIFRQTVSSCRSNVALVYQNKQMTYGELDLLTDAVAHRLKKQGIQKNDFIPIIADRGIKMIAAIVGVLKVGAAYVPIMPDYPPKRIEYIIADCKAKLILTCGYRENLNILQIDIEEALNNNEGIRLPEIEIQPQDQAYCIYTSGTTGKPKGVILSHKGVVAMRSFFIHEYQVTPSDNVLQFANFVFDASVWELTMSLFTGAKLTLIDKSIIADVSLFNEFVKKEKITISLLPPQYYLETDIKALRVLTTGGSAANRAVVEKAKDCEIYVNAYGPTESTVMATSWTPDYKDIRNVPIGRPIANSRIYILNNKKLCGIGMTGELCISGDGLAQGYLNNEQLTAEKFPDNPYESGKMYCTGDLARWLADGNIEYLGRIDEQVKISGYRIELSEVEGAIRMYNSVIDTAVIVSEDGSSEKNLCAYLTASNQIDIQKLNVFLQELLPYYMIPTHIMQIAEIPLTANGKLNKKELPSFETLVIHEYTAPRDKLEEILCNLMQEITGRARVGVNDNLFELGVNSLKAIRIVGKIKKLGININIKDIFEKKTVNKLAEKVRMENALDVDKADIMQPMEVDQGKAYSNLLQANVVDDNLTIVGKRLNNTLITGATGFLGIHLLADFIERESGNLYCLVRSENEQEGYQRLLSALDYYFGNKYHNYLKKRIFVVSGTIEQEDIKKYLPSDINTVIHSAAITKHYGFEEDFIRVNVSGTKRMLEYAVSIGAKFVYISTTSVGGRKKIDNSSPLIYDETYFSVQGEYHTSEYTKTKHQAEMLVLDAKLNGADTVILRVGNLTNRSTDGKPIQNYQDNRFMNMLKYVIEEGYVNSQILNLDLQFSPVDLVASAVINLIRNNCEKHSVYHVYNDNMIKFERIFHLLKEYNIILSYNETETYHYTDNLNSEFAIIMAEEDEEDLVYPEASCDFTKWLLNKSGFNWKQIDDEYLNKVVKCFCENGFWKR